MGKRDVIHKTGSTLCSKNEATKLTAVTASNLNRFLKTLSLADSAVNLQSND